MNSTQDIKTMLEDCEKREERLSAWEHDFIVSVKDQFEVRGFISEKQDTRLEEIWNKVTSH